MNNLTQNQKIAAIVIGAIIAIVGIYFGFRVIFGRASGSEPQNVRVEDITQNSAKAKWESGIESQCTVEYGTSPTAMNSFAPETRETTTHSVELNLLTAGTTYHFIIRCGDNRYDNSGAPWQFTTISAQPTVTSPTPVPTTVLPTATPTASASPTCDEASKNNPTTADCQAIKDKLGKGCNVQDYFKCRKKVQ